MESKETEKQRIDKLEFMAKAWQALSSHDLSVGWYWQLSAKRAVSVYNFDLKGEAAYFTTLVHWTYPEPPIAPTYGDHLGMVFHGECPYEDLAKLHPDREELDY